MRAPIHDLHASNLLTYASIAAAIGAVAMSRGFAGLSGSGTLLAAAAFLDTFDGRFARQFTRNARQQRIGGQLDSLADAVVFGLTPVVILTALPQGPGSGFEAWSWWTAAFVYVLASVTRLGFFAVDDDQSRFVGVPTPAIALLWSTVLLHPPAAWSVTGLFLICAALMTAPIPIPRPRGVGLAVFALWAIVLIVLHLRDALG